MYLGPGGEGDLVNAFESPGACSTMEGGGVGEGSTPGVVANTKIHAGVASGSKEKRSWFSVEVRVSGAMVALTVWISFSEGDTGVGWGWG